MRDMKALLPKQSQFSFAWRDYVGARERANVGREFSEEEHDSEDVEARIGQGCLCFHIDIHARGTYSDSCTTA